MGAVKRMSYMEDQANLDKMIDRWGVGELLEMLAELTRARAGRAEEMTDKEDESNRWYRLTDAIQNVAEHKDTLKLQEVVYEDRTEHTDFRRRVLRGGGAYQSSARAGCGRV